MELFDPNDYHDCGNLNTPKTQINGRRLGSWTHKIVNKTAQFFAFRTAAALVLLSIQQHNVSAQVSPGKTPPECLDRTSAGSNIPGGWAFVLNFNNGSTDGCLITVNADGSRNFEPTQCFAQGDIAVSMRTPGAGSATFNPGATLYCDVNVRATEAAEYTRNREDYWMTAHASFAQPGRYSLMRYNSTSGLFADVAQDGALRISSEYGVDGFEYAHPVGFDNSMFVRSTVNGLSGRHELTYRPFTSISTFTYTSPATRMKAIDFPNSGLLIVGAPDSTGSMTLDELILDPSGRCCSGG
jgi:hypothetical protein